MKRSALPCRLTNCCPTRLPVLPAMNQVYVIFIAVLDRAVTLYPKAAGKRSMPGGFAEDNYPIKEVWAPARGFDMGKGIRAGPNRCASIFTNSARIGWRGHYE